MASRSNASGLPAEILAHLAVAGPTNRQGLAVALRPLGSDDPIVRALGALVDAKLVTSREGTVTGTVRGVAFQIPTRLYDLTARGRRAVLTKTIPNIAVPGAKRRNLSSDATPLRARIRAEVLELLREQKVPLSAGEIVAGLADPTSSETIRRVVVALAEEGTIAVKTVSRVDESRAAYGVRRQVCQVKVYSLTGRVRSKR